MNFCFPLYVSHTRTHFRYAILPNRYPDPYKATANHVDNKLIILTMPITNLFVKAKKQNKIARVSEDFEDHLRRPFPLGYLSDSRKNEIIVQLRDPSAKRTSNYDECPIRSDDPHPSRINIQGLARRTRQFSSKRKKDR